MITLEAADLIEGDASAVTVVDFTINGVQEAATVVSIKALADGQLAGAKGTIYTTPGSTTAIIKSIILVNTDSSARTVNLYVQRDGSNSRRIIPEDLSLEANGGTLVLSDRLYVYDSAGQIKYVVTTGTHNMLDGSIHPDSVADTVTRGSIIYGNATPKWDELVKGGANTFLGSDGTDLSYRTATQVRTSISVAENADVTGSNPPQAHKDLHDPNNGSDALDTAGPSELASVQNQDTGSSHSLARADHGHQIQHSIADNHLVTMDDSGPANSGEYAKLTASGIAGSPVADVMSDLSGAAGAAFDWNNQILQKVKGLTLTDFTELTIDGAGEITVTQMCHSIDTASDDPSDDLDTINGGGTVDLILIRPIHGDRTIVVKHNDGNIWLQSGSDVTLDDISDTLMLVYDNDNSVWVDIGVPHKVSHQNGGDDEISVAGLSGTLADDQHVLDAEVQAVSINALSEDSTPALGGNLDMNEKGIQHTHNLDTDGKWEGDFEAGVCGETLLFGAVVYLKTADQRWWKTNATGEATSGDVMLGIMLEGGTAGQSKKIGKRVYIREDDWNFTSFGQAIFLDEDTNGGMIQTAPAGSGEIVRVVGYADTDANVIEFDPNKTWLELA